MPYRYTYTGDLPTLLVGLSQGVGATHTPAAGNPTVPEDATVVVYPGDTVETLDAYVCASLEEIAPNQAPASSVPAVDPVAAPAPANPTQIV